MVFAKSKRKNIINCCHENFDNKKFEEELKEHLFSVLNFGSFHSTLKTSLDRFALLKQKVMLNNNQPFVTKTLCKAIVKRSKLRNKFNKGRNAKNGPITNNNEIMVQIFGNNSFNNLNVKDVTENNTF